MCRAWEYTDNSMHVYICVCKHISVYIHIYIYIYRCVGRENMQTTACSRIHATFRYPMYTYNFLTPYIPTNRGDQTSNNYDCQNFQQLFTGVPVHIKRVFTRVPKSSNQFLGKWMESLSLKRSARKSGRSGDPNVFVWLPRYLFVFFVCAMLWRTACAPYIPSDILND